MCVCVYSGIRFSCRHISFKLSDKDQLKGSHTHTHTRTHTHTHTHTRARKHSQNLGAVRLILERDVVLLNFLHIMNKNNYCQNFEVKLKRKYILSKTVSKTHLRFLKIIFVFSVRNECLSHVIRRNSFGFNNKKSTFSKISQNQYSTKFAKINIQPNLSKSTFSKINQNQHSAKVI